MKLAADVLSSYIEKESYGKAFITGQEYLR